MTRPDDRPDREADALDRYLDDLTAGDPVAPPDLDQRMAHAARRIRSLADATTDRSLSADLQRHQWEDLMDRHAAFTPGVSPATTPHPLPAPVTLPVTRPASTVRPIRPAPVSWGRRIGSRGLGLVATLTLVLLVGLSGTALYLTAPGGGGEPTQLAGGLATPEAAGTPDTSVPPGDLVDVRMRECTTPPADYDQTMAWLMDGLLSTSPLPIDSSLVSSVPHPELSETRVYQLPAENPASFADVEILLDTFGRFLACGPLANVAMSTDSYTLRVLAAEGNTSAFYLFLWDDGTGDPRITADVQTSSYPRFGLYGARWLDGEHLGAYLTEPGPFTVAEMSGGETRQVEPTYDQRGYVIIERQPDGRWLVDELVYPIPAPEERCVESCGTPAA